MQGKLITWCEVKYTKLCNIIFKQCIMVTIILLLLVTNKTFYIYFITDYFRLVFLQMCNNLNFKTILRNRTVFVR